MSMSQKVQVSSCLNLGIGHQSTSLQRNFTSIFMSLGGIRQHILPHIGNYLFPSAPLSRHPIILHWSPESVRHGRSTSSPSPDLFLLFHESRPRRATATLSHRVNYFFPLKEYNISESHCPTELRLVMSLLVLLSGGIRLSEVGIQFTPGSSSFSL